jgi:SAM-dependent methyltransferase
MFRPARRARCAARPLQGSQRPGALAIAVVLTGAACGNASPGPGATKTAAHEGKSTSSDPGPTAKLDPAPAKAPTHDAGPSAKPDVDPNAKPDVDPSADVDTDAKADANVAADTAASEEPVQLDIEFVPTPDNVVRKMLGVAKITKHDVVYDLGCGDGRLVIAAAKKFGAKGVGFDLDPVRVAEARANVEKAGVGHLVTIEQKNIFDVDLSPASVVTLYLLPSINVKLIPQLDKLAPGSRIISHDFGMEGVEYDDVWTIVAKHHRPPPATRDHYVYKWTAPLKKVASVPAE